MDRKYIDDHHIVARYLAEQLPDSEREAFEAYYLEHPDLVREMEAAARFKMGMQRLQDAVALDALLKSRPWFRQARYLAAAASVAIVFVGLFVWFSRAPSAQPLLVASPTALMDRLGRPLPSAGVHMILRTRGSAFDAQIHLPATPHLIELRVLPETQAQPPHYRVTLASISENGSLREAAAIAELAAAPDGFVPVYLNSARLARGRYQLLLAPETGSGAASTFVIQISGEADK